jgi:AmmeMemoRadiSam system protein A/AmmeMemoRadiSam system protein B
MNDASTLVFAGIAPHPPIMVPEVGREAIAEVRGSIDAMAELTARVIASGAETVILISPHAPLDAQAFVAYHGPELYGDFANFRAAEAVVAAELDAELLEAITRSAAEKDYEVRQIENEPLDHGTAVPLYFLQRNGWHGRVVALGYSFLSNEDHVRFGKAIRTAVDSIARPVAFIASGDLSHRLKLGAPAGYSEDAHRFDEEVVAALQAANPARVINIDQGLRRLAGECGYRSMLVAFGVSEGLDSAAEVLHYEAPFGVGYLVAQLVAANPARTARGETRKPTFSETDADFAATGELPALARRAVETFVNDRVIIEPPAGSEILANRAACFVSIKTLSGDLRGCIGTTEPTRNTLAEELIANAVSAATRDPRFPPVQKTELDNLKYSVDVLSEPEPAVMKDLDPEVYGVIVEGKDCGRRGLLLPNLEGVDTAEQQVEIAARKAGIPTGAELKLWRFRATRCRENPVQPIRQGF